MTTGSTTESWLLVSVSSVGGARSLRRLVWRTLRLLGALYLQQSVCLLPVRPAVVREVRRLSARIVEQGWLGPCPDHELRRPDRGARRGRRTCAEVEESEAGFARFVSWQEKIASRDYFDPPNGHRTRGMIAAAAEALSRFEEAALRAQTGPAGTVRSLEAVAEQ